MLDHAANWPMEQNNRSTAILTYINISLLKKLILTFGQNRNSVNDFNRGIFHPNSPILWRT